MEHKTNLEANICIQSALTISLAHSIKNFSEDFETFSFQMEIISSIF